MKNFVILLVFTLLAAGSKAQSGTVLVCEGSRSYAYHNHYCEGLKQCRAVIERISLDKALAMKRTPCHYCYKNGGVILERSPSTTPLPIGGQCKAITKKGTRCSRKAGSNGYCWQHAR